MLFRSKIYRLTFSQSADEPFLIPIELGLLSPAGDDITAQMAVNLSLADKKSGCFEQGIFRLTDKQQVLTFENVEAEPIPSLLRDFSAPIKLNYPMTRDQLMFLMQHDSDGFNCWDAGQRLALDVIAEVTTQIKQGDSVSVDARLIKAYRGLLQRDDVDHGMMAKLLMLPSVSYIAETQDIIDIHGINNARTQVLTELSNALAEPLAALYQTLNQPQQYLPEPKQMAQRGLKNAALGYLLKSSDPQYCQLAVDQFASSDNMTDSMAALSCLVNSPYKIEAEKALEAFYKQWQHEPLVVNQWFSVQAGSAEYGSLENIQRLLNHEAFDIKNPNKVRAVIGAFAGQSLVNFHAKDGLGYQLLADQIITLNSLNPQMASRLIAPLTKWRRYVAVQGELMKQQLQRIMAEEALSKDVFEVVSKSLAASE